MAVPILTAAAYAVQLLDLANALAAGMEKMKQFAAEGRDPTPAEWSDLNKTISALRAELHKGE